MILIVYQIEFLSVSVGVYLVVIIVLEHLCKKLIQYGVHLIDLLPRRWPLDFI